MEDKKVRKLILIFWKKLILHNLGIYLLIDGFLSVCLSLFLNVDTSILFAMWIGGIPRYVAGAMAGAKCLSGAINEVSKEQ